MFSIKLDALFADLEAAKALARKLSPGRSPRSDLDPRELQRMKDELRAAQEGVRAQAILHRYHLI